MATTSGCVKWFNNKAGYGFITVNDLETNEERDIFVHHSEIKVDQSQYKYLVQGEYVEFTVSPITREAKIDVHATNVRGINSGKLMCETRNEVRANRISSAPQTRRDQTGQERPRPSTAPSSRPQLDKADQTEWKVVPRRKNEASRSETAHKSETVNKSFVKKEAAPTFSGAAPTFSTPAKASGKSASAKPKQRQPEIEIA